MSIEECLNKIPKEYFKYGLWGCIATLKSFKEILEETNLSREDTIKLLEKSIAKIKLDMDNNGMKV